MNKLLIESDYFNILEKSAYFKKLSISKEIKVVKLS